MSRTKYWSRRFVPWLAVLAGLLLVVFVTAVLAVVTSVNIDSPTQANPVYKKAGDSFTVQYDVVGSDEVVTVKIYLGATQVYNESVSLPVTDRQVNPVVPVGTADGKYDLKVEAVGSSTKSKTESDAVIVDNTAPTVVITNIPDCVGSLASMGGTASDTAPGVVDKVYVKIKNTSDTKWWNGSAWVGADPGWLEASGTTSWTYNVSGIFQDGKSYQVWAKAKDKAGNETAPPPTDTFTVDLTNPTVAITNPPTGWKNSVPTLAGTATYTGCSGVASVQVQVYNVTGARYWNGTQWVATLSWVAVTTWVAPDWTYTTMPTLTAGRTYQIKAKATDGADHSAESAASTFQYDDVDPTEAFIAPVAGKYYNAAPTPFTGTAYDAHSGVNKVQLTLQRSGDSNYWTGSAWGASTWLTATGTTSWSYTSVITWTTNVTYTLTAKATDNAGNEGLVGPTGLSIVFYYDTTKPTVTLNNIADKVGCAFASIGGTAGDTFSGLDKVYVKIKNNTDGDWWTGTGWGAETWLEDGSTSPWTYDVSGVSFEDGDSYTVSAKSKDIAGNESDLASNTFSYDACPTVAFTAPAAGALLNDLNEFTGTAADVGSGSVQDVQVMIQKGLTSTCWDGTGWVACPGWLGATDTSAGGSWSTWKYATSGITWPDEQYILHAKAEDNFPQESDVVTRTFTIDATPPTVTINAIGNNTQPTQFSGTATDTPAGLDWVKIAIENESGQYWTGAAWGAETWHEVAVGSPWSYNAGDVEFQGGETYTVHAKGMDNAGNESAPVQDAFIYGASADIPLGAGWNLMSLPLIPNDDDITAVMTGLNVIRVSRWTSGVGEERWEPDPSMVKEFTTMTTGLGYWVKLSSAGTLENAGLFQPVPPGAPKSYPVYEGWNLIGYHPTTQTLLGSPDDVEVYLGDTLKVETRAMYYYEGGMYKIPLLADPMKVGFGYWLALDAGGTIYP